MNHRLRISRAGAAVAMALLAAACGGDSDDENRATLPVAAGTSSAASTTAPGATGTGEISAEDAASIALDEVGGGQVVETDIEDFEIVVQVWEITVVGSDGVRRKVTVDMTNGSVVSNQVDD